MTNAINFSHRVPKFLLEAKSASVIDICGPSLDRARTMVELLEQAAQMNQGNGSYLFDHDVINLCGAIRLELKDTLALLKAYDESEPQRGRNGND